jgi:hypothetical protein
MKKEMDILVQMVNAAVIKTENTNIDIYTMYTEYK